MTPDMGGEVLNSILYIIIYICISHTDIPCHLSLRWIGLSPLATRIRIPLLVLSLFLGLLGIPTQKKPREVTHIVYWFLRETLSTLVIYHTLGLL